jgi:hypothetical protein
MTTDTWSVDADGFWSTAGDWSENHIPLTGEDVAIATSDPHKVTFDVASSSINSLAVGDDTLIVASGALTIAGAASFGGLLQITGGTLDFAAAATTIGPYQQTGGALDIQSGTLSFDGADDSFAGTVEGAGTLAIVGGGATIAAGAAVKVAALSVSGASTKLTLSGNTTYGGGFTLAGNATVSLAGASLVLAGKADFSGGTVNGAHNLDTEGATTVSSLTIGGTANWVNTGTVTQSGGTVTIGDAGGGASLLYIATKATYDITDASDINSGSGAGPRIANAGLFAKTSSSGTSVIKPNFTSTGTVACAGGDLEFDGPHNLLSGTYIGPGMIDYGPDGVSNLGNLNITQSACGTNYGIVNVTGVVTIADGSTIVNDSGATWNFAGDVGLALAAGSSTPLFTNDATMAKTSGSGTSVVAIDVHDLATVKVAVGTLAFDGAANTVGGTIVGAGAFVLGGGNTTIESGATAAVAALSVSGAGTHVTVDDALSYAGVFGVGAGATLSLTANDYVALSGSATIAGATVNGAGKLVTGGTTTVSGATIGGTVKWINTNTVTESGGDVHLGDASGATALLNNSSTATYDILDDSGIARGSSTASYIYNSGLLEKTGGSGTSGIATAITNMGVISVTSGTLDLNGSVMGSGVARVGAGAVLEVDGVVGGGQSLAFSGSGGEISLADLDSAGVQLFHGSITGFGADDSIDIGAATFAGYSSNPAHTAGILKLTEGTASATINFVGNYSATNFVSNIAAGGDTILTFHA